MSLMDRLINKLSHRLEDEKKDTQNKPVPTEIEIADRDLVRAALSLSNEICTKIAAMRVVSATEPEVAQVVDEVESLYSRIPGVFQTRDHVISHIDVVYKTTDLLLDAMVMMAQTRINSDSMKDWFTGLNDKKNDLIGALQRVDTAVNGTDHSQPRAT